jgi:hypothetical protein
MVSGLCSVAAEGQGQARPAPGPWASGRGLRTHPDAVKTRPLSPQQGRRGVSARRLCGRWSRWRPGVHRATRTSRWTPGARTRKWTGADPPTSGSRHGRRVASPDGNPRRTNNCGWSAGRAVRGKSGAQAWDGDGGQGRGGQARGPGSRAAGDRVGRGCL